MNEYIAQEISKGMQERGTFVFDTKDNATYINTTSYESFFFLIDEFFQEFKKEILASRRHGNIDAIWNAVGKENFEALNDIISEYCEHFSAPFALHKLFESIKKGEETEDTKYASEMRNRRIEVLEKMRMHYMLHTPQVQETEQKKESSL